MKLEKIVKTFYDSLEEGKILGRKCKECGHIEFPPYLACNTCGCLDTEWVEISGKGMVTQILAPAYAFSDPVFGELVGEYCLASVEPENADAINTCLLHCSQSRVEELRPKLPLPVKAVIIQEDGFKNVFWELEE